MTLMHLSVLSISLAGFVALALAMPRHSQHLLRKTLSEFPRRGLRMLGWGLLAIALGLGIAQWRFDVGMVTWLGWLTVAGVGLVFCLPNWQPRARSARPDGRKRDGECNGKRGGSGVVMLAVAPRHYTAVRIGFATAVLLVPLGGLSWQLLHAPDKPLLREDAVHGQIGPWSYTLAEKDHKPPEIVAMGIPLKAFVIRFCDACDRDIRMAYLKVREPRSLRAAGNAFEGRGLEKTAEIPLPRAATLEDGIWLTVEGNNGEVHHQRFDIRRLSPALARSIGEGT